MTETSTGIDSHAMLGVMAALNGEIFNMQSAPADKAYLTFPLVALPFRADDLRFDPPGGRSSTQASCFAEFSELVNRLPAKSALWSEHSYEHLWDIYGAVLDADVADRVVTPADSQRLSSAEAVLHQTGADGYFQDSPKVVAYRKACAAWREADAVYTAIKSGATAGNLASSLAAVNRAMDEWIDTGFKAEVEQAWETLEKLTASSPSALWHNARMVFNPDEPTSYMTTPDGVNFAPTPFSPSVALDPDAAWSRLTLTRKQLAALADAPTTPQVLRDRFGGRTSSPIDSLSFDYIAVDLVRGWLPATMLTARVWRFRPGQPPLYDPTLPLEQCRCPAYVTGVVFARNITVTGTVSAGQLGPLDTSGLQHLASTAAGPDRAALAALRRAALATNVDPGPQVLLEHHPSSLVPREADGASGMLTHALMTLRGNRPDSDPDPDPIRPPILWRPPHPPPPVVPAPPQPTPTPHQTTPQQTTTSTGPNIVLLVAFACTALPKAPDPDPALTFRGDSVRSGSQRRYVVVAGDTLWAVAERFYGDGNQYTRIQSANHITDPTRLAVGTSLIIP